MALKPRHLQHNTRSVLITVVGAVIPHPYQCLLLPAALHPADHVSTAASTSPVEIATSPGSASPLTRAAQSGSFTIVSVVETIPTPREADTRRSSHAAHVFLAPLYSQASLYLAPPCARRSISSRLSPSPPTQQSRITTAVTNSFLFPTAPARGPPRGPRTFSCLPSFRKHKRPPSALSPQL
jgi:hypothetical protein